MRHFRPLVCLLSLTLMRGVAAAAADASVLQFDQARSHAEFEVKVLFLIGLHGDFGSLRGELRLDPTGEKATVDATIDTNVLHMRSRRYEHWTQSAEFFDTTHFPQIHFVSEPFARVLLTRGGRISGALTLRGTTRPAQFDIDAAACTAPLRGDCAVTASGLVRRSEFGMRSRRGTLSDKVDLDLTIFVQSAAAEPMR